MSATLLQGHPQAKRTLPTVRSPQFTDLESWMDFHMNNAGPLDQKTGTFSSGKFAGQTPQQVNTYLQSLGAQSGFKPRAQMMQPTSAPAMATPPATAPTPPTTAPTPATPQAPMPNTGNPGAMVDTSLKAPGAAPKPPSLINGQPSAQFFQDAANRQGRANSYGKVQPQTPVATAPTATPAPAPNAVATQATAVENRHPALFGKVTGISGNQAPLASAATPPPAAAPSLTMPQVTPRTPGVTPRPSPQPQPTNTLARMESMANSMPRPSTDLTKMPQPTNTLARMESIANSMPRPSTDLTKMPQPTNTLARMESIANSMPRPSTDLTKRPQPTNTLARMESMANSMPRPSTDLTKRPRQVVAGPGMIR